MSIFTHHPERGRAGDVDPGGTGARQPQGARARRRVFNAPAPGVYQHNIESGTTWACVAAENAKQRKELGLKETHTIVISLMRENNSVRYQMSPEEVETLIFDNVGLKQNKLVWFDDSYFRTLMFGVELDVNFQGLKLGISHKIREGLKTKACHPIADTVTLRIFWTQYAADREAIAEVLENFGRVEGDWRHQTFPRLRKDGTESRLANVERGDLTVRFKPTKMLPSYIRVKGKKIKVAYENQTPNCPRCYRFPMKVGELEPCLGKLDPTSCSYADPKGEDYKYDFDKEWELLMKEVGKNADESDGINNRPLMSFDAGFVASEDLVELTNVPEDAPVEEIKTWMDDLGLVLEESVQIKQSSFPGTWQIINLDAEMAETIKKTCWGKPIGSGKRTKKVFVDLVRDKTKEKQDSTATNGRSENGSERSDKQVEEEEILTQDFVTDDEDTTDDDSIFATLGGPNLIEKLVTEASKLRKERIVKQVARFKNPEGGVKPLNLKEMLLEQQITAKVLSEACAKCEVNPDERQAKKIKNLIRKRTREDLEKSPPFKIRQQNKKQKDDGFKAPVMTPVMSGSSKPKAKSRSRSGSTSRSRSRIKGGTSSQQ